MFCCCCCCFVVDVIKTFAQGQSVRLGISWSIKSAFLVTSEEKCYYFFSLIVCSNKRFSLFVLWLVCFNSQFPPFHKHMHAASFFWCSYPDYYPFHIISTSVSNSFPNATKMVSTIPIGIIFNLGLSVIFYLWWMKMVEIGQVNIWHFGDLSSLLVLTPTFMTIDEGILFMIFLLLLICFIFLML